MLLRTIVQRQSQGQRFHLLGQQLRNASHKSPTAIPRPVSTGLGGVNRPNHAAESASSSIKTATNSSTGSSSISGTNARNSRKVNKAKAQASASRALREELASIVQKDSSGTQSAEVDEAILQNARKEDTIVETIEEQPTRKLYDAIAFATAESYDIQKLVTSNRLPAGWQLLEDGEVIHIPDWPLHKTSGSISSSASLSSSGGGEVFVFQSGSYVTWGLSNEQSRRFLRSVVQGRAGTGQSAEIEPYQKVGDEAVEFIVADDQITRMVGDVIVIGQAPRVETEDQFDPDLAEEKDGSNSEDAADWSPLLARLAFSQGLSRSARLSVQEDALSTYLEEVASLPGKLEQEGKVPLHRKEVIRKMGTLLKLRQRANLDSENFLDDPEMYWENWKVEHHYDSICLALDIESRFKAYNEKLDHGENLLGIMRALLTESSTHRMELIIIYLIAVEVCLAFISHGYFNWAWKSFKMQVLGVEEVEVSKSHSSTDDETLSMLRRLLAKDASEVTSSPHLV